MGAIGRLYLVVDAREQVMRKTVRPIILICASLLPCLGGPVQAARAIQSRILAQNLASNVIWTRREDRCTLQILVNWKTKPRDTLATTSQSRRNFQLVAPTVEVWLLTRDGAAIPPERRWQTPTPKSGVQIRERTMEVNYTFPLYASTEAIAVVISTDGDVVVKKITPFSNQVD
jgi:hypothetical protein